MQSSEYKFGILSQKTHWIYIIIRVIWERIAWGGPLNDSTLEFQGVWRNGVRMLGCTKELGREFRGIEIEDMEEAYCT